MASNAAKKQTTNGHPLKLVKVSVDHVDADTGTVLIEDGRRIELSQCQIINQSLHAPSHA